MDSGLQLVVTGALLVTSLLLRNAAAGHVSPEMVPACLAGRLRFINRMAPIMLAVAAVVALSGLTLVVVSQMVAT